jgi:hypothetical protein
MTQKLAFLPIFLFWLACAPAPVLRLSPLSSETKWIYGKEFASSATDDLEIAVAFESMDEAAIIFDVEVTNLAGQPVLISPERFYYLSLAVPEDTISLVATPKRISSAIDPEFEILDLDKKISRENASYATAAGIDAIGSLIGLFVDIATIGKKKTEQEIKEEEQSKCEDERFRRERQIDHENSLANLKNEKAKWESTTLRRTTLDPEQSLRGRVYFPANDKTKYLKLCFPIGEANVQIVFEQKKVKA